MLEKVLEWIKDPNNLAFVISIAAAIVLVIVVFVATSASRAAKKKKAKNTEASKVKTTEDQNIDSGKKE